MIRTKLQIIILLVGLFLTTFTAVSGASFTVVIDAGHGGRDPGALGRQVKEKDVNLAVALKLGRLIRDSHPDVKVVYTRSTDVFVALEQRARIANRAKADLFISIHSNANRTRSLYGTETYTLGLHRSEENLEVAKRENSVILLEDDYTTRYEGFNPAQPESYIIFELLQNTHLEQSISLAAHVQREFRSAKRVDRGVRQAGLLVLRNTGMPSVLVELGYLSNANEEAYLRSEQGKTTLARAIYRAFRTYKQSIDQKQGNMVITSPPNRPYNKMEAAANSGKIVYKIQILSHHQKLPTNSKLFKGLKGVEMYREGKTYKYTYKAASSIAEIERERKKIKHLFKDAFVVRFRNGERIK